jgi:hypothetical protein
MDDSPERELMEIPLLEYLYLLDIVDEAKQLFTELTWAETPNEHLMFVRSDTPGGPKVFRDRLRRSLMYLDTYRTEE